MRFWQVLLGLVAWLGVAGQGFAATPLSPEDVNLMDQKALMARFMLAAAQHYKDPPSIHIDLLKTWNNEVLGRIRRSCAQEDIQVVIDGVQLDHEKIVKQGARSTVMPDLATYCLAAIAEGRRRNTTADLYIDLALQEQGYDTYYDKFQDVLLANNEAGKTFQAILTAAYAGQASYTAVGGAVRPFYCPMALDAGETWAANNPTASLPVEMSAAEAMTAAHACYETLGKPITVHGTDYPPQKAGVVIGAWLARH